MLHELDACDWTGSTVLLEAEQPADPGFLLFHFLSVFEKHRRRSIFCLAHCNEADYRMAASKLRVPWNANSLTVFNLADLITSAPFHCSDLISTVLERLIGLISVAGECPCLLLDSVSIFEDVGCSPSDLVRLVATLAHAVAAQGGVLVLVAESDCRVIEHLRRVVDHHLCIRIIGTGFAKDVTGQLDVTRRGGVVLPEARRWHYFLGERSARLFPPGSTRPAL